MGDDFPVTVVSVTEAAARLAVAPHRVRRLLQSGRLPGRKLGREWAALWPTDMRMHGGGRADDNSEQGLRETPHLLTTLRQQLRQVGTTLIRTGNAYAQARPARGAIFLTWRRPKSLAVTFAMGRVTSTQQWAPYALGSDLPFWLTDRARWTSVIPVVRRYDRVRGWCVPQLVRCPGVAAVIGDEIMRLEEALARLDAELARVTHRGRAITRVRGARTDRPTHTSTYTCR